MECLSGRGYGDDTRMAALSYEHRRTTEAINSRLLQQEYAMKQESSSPPLTKANNNNNNNNNTPGSAVHVAASAMALSDINAAAAAMGILTPQQLAFAQTAFLASLHGGQPPLLGGYNPLFTAAWPSPPRSPGPVSPALSAKSSHSSIHRKTPSLLNNNNSHNLNNNVQKKKPKTGVIAPPVKVKSVVEGGPVSPAVSEGVKETQATTGRDKTFTCGVCNRSFGYKHVLQNHERTHTGEKPFKCPECNKRFTRDHHLKTHMRLHTGEKPYHCTHCDRHFVQVANLRRHLRVHTGERPYTCTICQSKFSDSNQLKSHVLTHRNQKPFRCELCDTSFRRRHHLTGHKCSGRVHPSSVVSTHLEEDVDMYPGAVLPLNLTQSCLPEQTEPEDLSMRTRDSSTGSPMSSSCSEEDPDESR